MTIDPSKPVLVTGGNGYIASWLVRYLLEDGMDVHASVRDPDNADKVGHLESMAAQAKGELTLFRADLLDAGAFDAAMAGCELVCHTASPFVVKTQKDTESQFVKPALRGTENVLASANNCDSVKRVVLTSSVAAVYGDAIEMSQAHLDAFDESHWNTTSSADHQAYSYSKRVAEKRAWEMQAQQDRWDLVTINPGFVLGPSLAHASDSGSIETITQLVDGTMRMGAPELYFGVVDVRDVARAHKLAGYADAASGRYITCAESLGMLDLGTALREAFGNQYPFPKRYLPKWLLSVAAPFVGLSRDYVARNVGYPLAFDNHRIKKDLGMTFRPARESVVAHFQQMLDDGLVRKR